MHILVERSQNKKKLFDFVRNIMNNDIFKNSDQHFFQGQGEFSNTYKLEQKSKGAVLNIL